VQQTHDKIPCAARAANYEYRCGVIDHCH
jgi:hypothetical protein